MPYDLLLRGGRVIDPAQNLDGVYDIAVSDGRKKTSAARNGASARPSGRATRASAAAGATRPPISIRVTRMTAAISAAKAVGESGGPRSAPAARALRRTSPGPGPR